MKDEIKEILDTPIFIIDNEGFTVYINDKLQNYITNLQEENQKLVNVIEELVKHAYGTEMSLGEFKTLFKIATGKDFIPTMPFEKQLTELKGGSE